MQINAIGAFPKQVHRASPWLACIQMIPTNVQKKIWIKTEFLWTDIRNNGRYYIQLIEMFPLSLSLSLSTHKSQL
jgi:hypothetical protein